MGQFLKSLSDLTTWKNHIDEKMSSSEQEDQIPLHGGDYFSVEEKEPPIKKQKSKNGDFESVASRGLQPWTEINGKTVKFGRK